MGLIRGIILSNIHAIISLEDNTPVVYLGGEGGVCEKLTTTT